MTTTKRVDTIRDITQGRAAAKRAHWIRPESCGQEVMVASSKDVGIMSECDKTRMLRRSLHLLAWRPSNAFEVLAERTIGQRLANTRQRAEGTGLAVGGKTMSSVLAPSRQPLLS